MSTKGLALKLGLVNSSKIPVPLPMSVPIHSTTSVENNRRRSRIPSAEVDTEAHHSKVDEMKKSSVRPCRSSQRLSVQPSVNYNTTSASANTVNRGHSSASSQSVVLRSGKCKHCLRVMSLTVAGRLHSHGPGCPGSGQLPVDGSITNLSQSERNAVQLTTSQPNLGGNGSSASAPALLPEDIMDLLGQQRRGVLKRVPKASRIPAAEKLAQTLLQVITVPTCVENWKNLLTFTYACFSVPGQRGGKRHLSSLASKVNAALACFPATSINAQPFA